MTRWARSVLLFAVFLMAVPNASAFHTISGAEGSDAAARSMAVGATTPDAVVAPRAQGRFLTAAVRVAPMAALAHCASAAGLCLRGLGFPGAIGPRFEDVGNRWRALLIGAPPSFL